MDGTENAASTHWSHSLLVTSASLTSLRLPIPVPAMQLDVVSRVDVVLVPRIQHRHRHSAARVENERK